MAPTVAGEVEFYAPDRAMAPCQTRQAVETTRKVHPARLALSAFVLRREDPARCQNVMPLCCRCHKFCLYLFRGSAFSQVGSAHVICRYQERPSLDRCTSDQNAHITDKTAHAIPSRVKAQGGVSVGVCMVLWPPAFCPPVSNAQPKVACDGQNRYIL